MRQVLGPVLGVAKLGRAPSERVPPSCESKSDTSREWVLGMAGLAAVGLVRALASGGKWGEGKGATVPSEEQEERLRFQLTLNDMLQYCPPDRRKEARSTATRHGLRFLPFRSTAGIRQASIPLPARCSWWLLPGGWRNQAGCCLAGATRSVWRC